MENTVRLGDVGTIFRAKIVEGGIVVDISSANAAGEKKLLFQKPSMATLVKDAVFTTNGTDGYMQYVAVAGDLNELGGWKVQAYVKMDSWEGRSSVYRFTVEEALPM